MAVIRLRSTDGNDGDDGSTWALAKATLAAALTAAGAGGTVYMSQAHAETQASAMTLTSPGTAASPTLVLCVDDGADPPTALATTGTVTTTGTSNIVINASLYVYGVKFSCGDGTGDSRFNINNTSGHRQIFDNCVLGNGSTASGRIVLGITNSFTELIATSLKLGGTSCLVQVTTGKFLWRNSTDLAAGSSVPTTLFNTITSTSTYEFTIQGVDLSSFASGKNLLTISASALVGTFDLIDCKLGTSVSITTGAIAGNSGPKIRAVNCDSADTNYRYYLQTYQGTITNETTIVLTGGASDGTTTISRKMVSSANSKFYSPLYSDWMVIWNETTGSAKTATIEVVTDNVTLTDAEAWVEVEYLGTSGVPLGAFVSDRATNILTTPANQTSSSVTWTTTGLGTPIKQKLAAAFTAQEKGPVRVRVALAKASTTMYFNPLQSSSIT